MENKLVLGLIGAGRIGQVHGQTIAQKIPEATIKTVCDPFMDAEKISSTVLSGIGSFTTKIEDVFKDEEIDAVFICSSTDTHADLIVRAAQAGKHIFCEKPVDIDLDRIKEVIKVVEECGVKFQIGFNRRFDHNFVKIRRDIEDEVIGDPHILKITSRDPEPPPVEYVKNSGGIFLDQMIHDFDMARFLMGCEATSVFAKGEVLIDPAIGQAGDVDTAMVMLTFENGALGVIDNSRKAVYGYDQRAEVFGSRGCTKAENDFPNTVETLTARGVVREKPYFFFLERYFDAYVEEAKAFVEYVISGDKSPCSTVDAMMPVVMGLAAKKSLKEGRPVQISEII